MWCQPCMEQRRLKPAVANCRLKLDYIDWVGTAPMVSPLKIDKVLRHQERLLLCEDHLMRLAELPAVMPENIGVPSLTAA